MDIFTAGLAKKILEKYTEPIIKNVTKIARDEWEKFKTDFGIVFSEYEKKSYDKYSKIKTILYKTEPKFIYDFFECPSLSKENDKTFQPINTNDILDISRYIIIQGTGGIGKSTLMKHLFISEINNKDLIPIFIELKDLNDIKEDYSISELIFNKLSNLGSTLKSMYLDYALKSGCFLFLLDGYDEIQTEKKDIFFRNLDDFCDKFNENYFIISSRPYSEFIEFQRFTVLSTEPLDEEQAISLVRKIEFDDCIKSRFIDELQNGLFDKHVSFASNPLLLNIMLLTFENYANIPEKLHLFYANAFETLYSKHDATKSGYKRDMKCKLSYDLFQKLFSSFCFITYTQDKIEFTYDELLNVLKQAKELLNQKELEVEDYSFDLVNSLCVLYKDGLTYRFAHRSFQEYFTAIFLKDLTDDNFSNYGIQIIKKDSYKAIHDSVFSMLFDMCESRFEKNILLPILSKVESNFSVNEDKYTSYLRRRIERIKFEKHNRENQLWLMNRNSFSDENMGLVEFLCDCSSHYREKSIFPMDESEELLNYLATEKEYNIGESITCDAILEDAKLLTLLKETWIGKMLEAVSSMKDLLEAKQAEISIDLSKLLLH